MEDYEIGNYYLRDWTGNGELEDFVYWLDHSIGQGDGYYYYEGGYGEYSSNRISRELHTNNIIYVFE